MSGKARHGDCYPHTWKVRAEELRVCDMVKLGLKTISNDKNKIINPERE